MLHSNAGTTVIVQYGCTVSRDFQCDHDFETENTLLQCCYTDLCNQNFSKMLSSELQVNTPVANPTAAPSKRYSFLHIQPMHMYIHTSLLKSYYYTIFDMCAWCIL